MRLKNSFSLYTYKRKEVLVLFYINEELNFMKHSKAVLKQTDLIWNQFMEAASVKDLITIFKKCDHICTKWVDDGFPDIMIESFLSNVPTMVMAAKLKQEMKESAVKQFSYESMCFQTTLEYYEMMTKDQQTALLYYYEHKQLAAGNEKLKKMMNI